MKNFPGENGNLSDSSIYKARIRESELTSQEKLQEIQGAAGELARQSVINKLRQTEVEHEKLKLKLELEAHDRVEDILSHVELSAAENQDNFTSAIDGLLSKLFKFLNFMDSELGVETDPQVYSMIKEHEKEQAWIAGVIKFLLNKFNKLINVIFSRDLSFQQKIDKEIKELYEKLFSGSLSPEEEIAILQRLEALRGLKLKLQIFVVGTVIKMFAELSSVEMTVSVETTKEEGRNTEKASAKEATKEVRENLEIKLDAKEKHNVPVSLFDFSFDVARPITLSKPELDLLRNQIKKIVELPHKPAMNNKNSVALKPEVKGKQENKNKKPIQSAQKPNVAAPSTKAPGRLPGASGIVFDFKGRREESASFEERRINRDVGGVGERGTASTAKYGITSSFDRERPESSNKQGNQFISCKRYINGSVNSFNKSRIKSTNEQELGNLYNEVAKEVAKNKAKRKESAASIKHDYPIDHFQVPAETNVKSHANAKSEPKQGSVNNAQPKSECSSVKINNHVESIGNAPEEASRGI